MAIWSTVFADSEPASIIWPVSEPYISGILHFGQNGKMADLIRCAYMKAEWPLPMRFPMGKIERVWITQLQKVKKGVDLIAGMQKRQIYQRSGI